jgi:hypothetical protein
VQSVGFIQSTHLEVDRRNPGWWDKGKVTGVRDLLTFSLLTHRVYDQEQRGALWQVLNVYGKVGSASKFGEKIWTWLTYTEIWTWLTYTDSGAPKEDPFWNDPFVPKCLAVSEITWTGLEEEYLSIWLLTLQSSHYLITKLW